MRGGVGKGDDVPAMLLLLLLQLSPTRELARGAKAKASSCWRDARAAMGATCEEKPKDLGNKESTKM